MFCKHCKKKLCSWRSWGSNTLHIQFPCIYTHKPNFSVSVHIQLKWEKGSIMGWALIGCAIVRPFLPASQILGQMCTVVNQLTYPTAFIYALAVKERGCKIEMLLLKYLKVLILHLMSGYYLLYVNIARGNYVVEVVHVLTCSVNNYFSLNIYTLT